MTVACTPVDSFDQGIREFRSCIRSRMPFTFIAYRSLIPDIDDDWYYLAQKVAWFVFVVFNFVEFAGKFSPILFAFPFVPMILDTVWVGAQYIGSPRRMDISQGWFRSIQIIGFAVFTALGVSLLFQKVRPW